jgi:precorrin-2 dehydrogenase/sirohydrochlorin ferrochelatase
VDAFAKVVYVNPEAEPEIQALAALGLIEWRSRAFQTDDLEGCFLVITDLEDNSEVFWLAEARNILCNAVDDPRYCRFSFGSIHRQGDLTVAISTNGWAPAVAVRLRQKLEQEVGPEYSILLSLLKEVRGEINTRIPNFERRKKLWYQIVDSSVLETLRQGQEREAQALIRGMIEEAVSST